MKKRACFFDFWSLRLALIWSPACFHLPVRPFTPGTNMCFLWSDCNQMVLHQISLISFTPGVNMRFGWLIAIWSTIKYTIALCGLRDYIAFTLVLNVVTMCVWPPPEVVWLIRLQSIFNVSCVYTCTFKWSSTIWDIGSSIWARDAHKSCFIRRSKFSSAPQVCLWGASL